MRKDWVIDGLMPLRLGARSQEGYRSLGVTVRRFTAADRKLTPGSRAYVALNHHKRTFEITLDRKALGGCPVARYLLGLHESAHIINGDVAPGQNARKLGAGDREIQEREAWRFVAEAAPKHLTERQIAFCFNKCVGAEPWPKECPQPDLPGLLKKLAGPVAAPEAVGLAGALLKAIKRNPTWFGTAAAGMKDSKGRPLIGKKRKAESRRMTGKRFTDALLREPCAGGICGPAEECTDPRLIWVRASDGKAMPELDPRLRLWHAD